MSRFIVTSGSDFRPFSYDELMKPVQDSARVHSAAADVYDQLSMETEALGRYISENENDADAKALYDNYINKLGQLQNDLWSNGFTARTRRDLSSARSAYSRDITRLQSAIQSRQERSKEYWDAYHKNPDLVMGYDPGTIGLNDYLKNSEAGRDWYSYSGTQFANEVGAEAKARAKELFDLYADKSNAPGYLVQVQRQGFTNAQVDGAGILAQQILSGQTNFDDVPDSAEKLLAGALISRLNSTGAAPGKNISVEQFGRMFDYGRLGLAQGVGDVNKKLIDDKVWDEMQKRSYAAYTHSLSNPVLPDNSNGYAIDAVGAYVENPDFAKVNAAYSRSVHNYRTDGPIVASVKGQQRIISSEADASRIFDEMGRSDIKQKYGVDPQLSFGPRGKKRRVETTFVMPDGREVQVRYVKMNNEQKKDFANDGFMDNSDGFDYEPIVVEQYVKGKWVTDPKMTRDFNRDYRPYRKQVQSLIDENKKNKDFDISRIALVGKAKKDYYKDANIPEYVPEQYAEAVGNTLNRQGIVTNSPIADTKMPDAVLDHYIGNIREYHARGVAAADKNGISKTSSFAFYPVAAGGIGYKKSGVTNPTLVFGSKGTGKAETPNYDSIIAIGATPEDIYDYGKVQIATDKGTFGVDPGYLGNAMANLIKNMQAPNPVVVDYRGNKYQIDDSKGIVHYLMLPISDPARVSVMSPDEQRMWYDTAVTYLRNDMGFVDRGTGEPFGPIQILMDDGLQNQLRNAVDSMLFKTFSQPRDWATQNPMQVVGETSSNAQPYIR